MKQFTIGVFADRGDAETAIGRVHSELGVPNDDISYLYRNSEGKVTEVNADDVSDTTPGEGAAQGAVIGGSLGALAGIAAVAGVIPVVGPLFAAGPLAAALGLTGAIGTTAAGAATGAAAGGLIGALVNIGVSEEHAKQYEDRVNAGDVLVAVHAEEDVDVVGLLNGAGALEVNVYQLSV